MSRMPNHKSPEPTAVGACSSAIAVHVAKLGSHLNIRQLAYSFDLFLIDVAPP
jgi:hypothetical protein